MKRLFSIVITAVLLVSLCACQKKMPQKYQGTLDLSHITESDINYNDHINVPWHFIAKDVVAYSDYNGNEEYFYLYKDRAKILLFSLSDIEGDSFDNNCFILNNRLYFSTVSLDSSTDETIILFYEYDFTSRKFTDIHASRDVSDWLVCEKGIYYNSDNGLNASSLYFFDFNTNKKIYITEGVYDFSIVNGKLRYVVYDNSFALMEYDPETTLTTELCRVSGLNPLSRIDFCFTKNKLIYFDANFSYANSPSIFIQDIKSGDTMIHKVSGNSPDISITEDYIFLHSYDELARGIYKLDLQTEEIAKLEYNPHYFSSFQTTPDNTMYILQEIDFSPANYMSKYFYKMVKYNFNTQQTTELFKY